MQTFFITVEVASIKYDFRVEAHDMRDLSQRLDWLSAGLKIAGADMKAAIVSLSLAKTRGTDYIDLVEWVRS